MGAIGIPIPFDKFSDAREGTRVTVVNATHMKVQAINYVNDSAFDEFWLEAP